MSDKRNAHAPGILDDQGFIVAQWPLSNPPLHPKADIISVAVGNSSTNWTYHSSYEQNYNPIVVWRTPAPSGDEKDNIVPTKLHLSSVIPKKMRVKLFGSLDFTVTSATQYRYARKRIPLIYVYVMSTNPKNAAHVVSLLKGTPCIFFRVSAEDFLVSPPVALADAIIERNGDTNQNLTNAKPVELYSGIGVDRVASMAGARILYPNASHILIIDGGTALTYTTIVEKVPLSFAGKSTLQLGGGICPGLQLRMRALYDFSDNIPSVDHTLSSGILKDCMEKKQPLPLFTSFPPLQDEASRLDDAVAVNDATAEDETVQGGNILKGNNESAIIKSILGCVMTEIALLLCCVVRNWLSIPIRKDPTDKDNLPLVVVTGGDAECYEKLLRHNHSYICETNPANVDLLNHGISDDDLNNPQTDVAVTRNHFVLKRKKNLQHYGFKSLLIQKAVFITPENENEETLRNQLLGLRVVLRKSTAKHYGTIFAVKRAVDFENDRYLVCSDTDGKISTMGMLDVYDVLSRYCESPEKPKSRDENLKIGYENKQKDALEAMDALRKKSTVVRNAVESRKPAPEAPVAPAPTLANVEGMVGQKRKHSEGNKSAKKKSLSDQKPKYIGRRIAKHFLVDDGGAQVMKLFFGTVMEYLKEHSWWHVEYDDGDNEDMSSDELQPYLKLYAENKSEDPKA